MQEVRPYVVEARKLLRLPDGEGELGPQQFHVGFAAGGVSSPGRDGYPLRRAEVSQQGIDLAWMNRLDEMKVESRLARLFLIRG